MPDSPQAPSNTPPTAPLNPYQQGYQAASDQQTTTVSNNQLAETKREFDLNLANQMAIWARQGLPDLLIRARAQQLAEAKFYADLKMAQANLGLSYLTQASQLRGPNNYYQAAAFARGAQQSGDVPGFLLSLRDNLPMASGGTAGNNGGPATMDSLAGQLAGTANGNIGLPGAQGVVASANPNSAGYDPTLGSIDAIFKRGGNALGSQAMEQLSSTEFGNFQSGGDFLGYDAPGFLKSYFASRIGQASGRAA